MIFKGGQLASQKVGAAPKGDLQRWIQAKRLIPRRLDGPLAPPA